MLLFLRRLIPKTQNMKVLEGGACRGLELRLLESGGLVGCDLCVLT